MVDQAIIDATAARLAALDFTAENDEISAIEAGVERVSAAERQAKQRVADINEELAEISVAPNGNAVADRLLAGHGDVTTIAPSRETLEAEREALAKGMNELRQRAGRGRPDIEAVRKRANHRLAGAVEDLVAELRQEAEAAARRMVDCYAALEAVTAVIGGHGPELRVTEMVARAAMGTAVHAGLLKRAPVSVPAEIIDLLALAANMGPAVHVGLLKEVKPY